MLSTQLQLVKSGHFGEMECDLYEKGDDFFMTREQIGTALEYAEPRIAISKIHAKNKERLDRFSTVTNLVTVDGKIRETYLYSHKGIYEICRWSNQPKANDFFDWVYDMVESLRRGELARVGSSEYLRATVKTYRDAGIDIHRLGKSAQVTLLKMMDQAGRVALKQTQRKAIQETLPNPGELIQELLSHAIPINEFAPANIEEVKTSVLRCEKYYYIFPKAARYYLRDRANKNDVHREIEFLGGQSMNKRFRFFGEPRARIYRVRLLPMRSNVVRLPG